MKRTHRAHLTALVLAVFSLLEACQKEETSLRIFHEQGTPTHQDLMSVWFSDSLHGVAGGGTPWEGGILLSTEDGGASWTTDTLPGNRMDGVQCDASGNCYACGLFGLAFQRAAGSRHWKRFREDFTWNRACFFPNGRYGLLVSGEGYRGGQVRVFGPDFYWQQDTTLLFDTEISDVCFSDSLTAHAVGFGRVMRSDDAGRTWQRFEITGDFFRSVQFPTREVGYVCGVSGTLLKTTDGGRSWQTIREGGAIGGRRESFQSLWFVTDKRGYAVGNGGLFWRTDNGGGDWQQVKEAPSGADFTDVFALGNHGWATARGGRIFYFEE